MFRLSRGMTVATIAACAMVGLGTTEASAAGTWTVSGSGTGGAFSGTATNPVLKDNTTSAQLTCTSSTASGTAPNGTGLSGTSIATVSAVSWTNCSGPFGITFTVKPAGLPWHFNAVSYNATTGVTTGTLSGVKASISGVCNATFGGAAGGTATLNGTYTNGTHTLAITGGTLIASGVSGSCFGLINNGDNATYTAKYVVTPSTLKVTSP